MKGISAGSVTGLLLFVTQGTNGGFELGLGSSVATSSTIASAEMFERAPVHVDRRRGGPRSKPGASTTMRGGRTDSGSPAARLWAQFDPLAARLERFHIPLSPGVQHPASHRYYWHRGALASGGHMYTEFSYDLVPGTMPVEEVLTKVLEKFESEADRRGATPMPSAFRHLHLRDCESQRLRGHQHPPHPPEDRAGRAVQLHLLAPAA